MRSLLQQVSDAFERSGWSTSELLKRSGLKIDRTSLGRKLKGQLRLNVDEAQAIAHALSVRLVWDARKAA